MKLRHRRSALLMGATVAAITLLGACSATPGGSAQQGGNAGASSSNKVILTIAGNTGGPQPRNFNPYLPTSGLNALWGAAGMIYETLAIQNDVDPSQQRPWLATSWAWTNDNKTLTFHLRQNVKWSDGQPFTSADVVFSFKMIKKNAQINTGGINFDSVSAPDASTVVMTFTQPSFTQFFAIGESALMVPQHIWKNVANPATYQNPKPVGTGPFLMTSFQPSAMLLTRNPHYWQPGLPKIYGLRYVQYSDSTTAEEDQEAGKIDWGGGPITNGQKLYVDRDPQHFHFWYPGTGIVSILPNQTVWPLNMTPVRQAISLAINRSQISKVGETGYEAPLTSPTGLLLPNFQSQIAPAYAGLKYTQNVAQAKKLLTQAGFKMDSNGLMALNGKEIKLNISDPTGFNDYMTDLQVISSELKAIGIKATVQGLSTNGWEQDIATGHFDMTVMWSSTGDLYTVLDSVLDYKLSGPIGTAASGGDYERWNNPATQAALLQYQTAASASDRTAALNEIQKIMVTQVPVIPIVAEADWGSYSTRKVTGFPSPTNQYASASAGTPNGEVVALHLVPVKN
jgi:peptide/nickel transport system substrate-binding protein